MSFFDHACYITDLESLELHVHSDYIDKWVERKKFSSIGDFKQKYILEFIDSLEARHNTDLLYFEEPDSVFTDEYLHFDVVIDRRYPFHSKIYAGEYIYGFGADYRAHWVWFFGWHETPYVWSGCS